MVLVEQCVIVEQKSIPLWKT